MNQNIYDTLEEPQKEMIQKMVIGWVKQLPKKHSDKNIQEQLIRQLCEGAAQKMKQEKWIK